MKNIEIAVSFYRLARELQWPQEKKVANRLIALGSGGGTILWVTSSNSDNARTMRSGRRTSSLAPSHWSMAALRSRGPEPADRQIFK